MKEFTCKRCAKTFKAKPVEKPSEHRLICADSTDKASVERLMNGEKAGLMATDPPYGVEYHGGNHPRSLSNSELVKDKHHADYQETGLGKNSSCNFPGIHPTEKPVAIFAWPMEWHIESGEVAFEPFAGSGTSLVGAEQTGRLCYAIEKAPAFVACTLERLSVLGLEPRRA